MVSGEPQMRSGELGHQQKVPPAGVEPGIESVNLPIAPLVLDPT